MSSPTHEQKPSALSLACLAQDVPAIHGLLDKGGLETSVYEQAFKLCAEHAQVQSLELLLHRAKRRIRAVVPDVFLQACQANSGEVVERLLAHYYKRLSREHFLEEGFIRACVHGSLQVVMRMAALDELQGSLSKGFASACAKGQEQVIEHLLKQASDKLFRAPHFGYGMMDMCRKGLTDICKKVVQHYLLHKETLDNEYLRVCIEEGCKWAVIYHHEELTRFLVIDYYLQPSKALWDFLEKEPSVVALFEKRTMQEKLSLMLPHQSRIVHKGKV